MYNKAHCIYDQIQRTDVDMIMGSLEGSICSIGGFCVGASVVMEHQRLSGLGYCFSASLPAFLTEIAIYAIELFEKNVTQFKNLESISRYFHERLETSQNFNVLSDENSPLKVIKLINTKITTTNIQEYVSYLVNKFHNSIWIYFSVRRKNYILLKMMTVFFCM